MKHLSLGAKLVDPSTEEQPRKKKRVAEAEQPKKRKESAPEPKKTYKAPKKEFSLPEVAESRYHNAKLEQVALFRMFEDEEVRDLMWPRYNHAFFASAEAHAIYVRTKTLYEKGSWPSLESLSLDASIPSAAREVIESERRRADKRHAPAESVIDRTRSITTATVADHTGHIFDLLDAYRVVRSCTECFTEAIEQVAGEEDFDPLKAPETMLAAAQKALGLQNNEDVREQMFHFGDKVTEADVARRMAIIDEMLSSDRPRYKTGLDALDIKGGPQPGEIYLLGAPTGSGKTALEITMMVNMVLQGTSCAMLQLEMSPEAMMTRLTCHIAEINTDVMRKGDLSEETQARIRRKFDKFNAKCEKLQSRLTVYAPSSASLSECEAAFRAYPYKVWFIDYASLLKPEKDDKTEGWEKLSKFTKALKALAKRYKIVIFIAVQVNVDADGKISVRYSKAMEEDADVALVWNVTPAAKQDGYVWVSHLKARQYNAFDFRLQLQLQYCKFISMPVNDDGEGRPEVRTLDGKKRSLNTEEMAKFQRRKK